MCQGCAIDGSCAGGGRQNKSKVCPGYVQGEILLELSFLVGQGLDKLGIVNKLDGNSDYVQSLSILS